LQTLLERALAVTDDREEVDAGTLLFRLYPDYAKRHRNYHDALDALERSLGVKLHFIERGDWEPERQGRRFNVVFLRADLEVAREQEASVPPYEVPRCEKCGAGKYADDAPCWRPTCSEYDAAPA
jgi:hypothetical protein